MKVKALLGLALLLGMSASALANPTRISNELATVKACSELLKLNDFGFSLDKINKATVDESTQRLTVELSWTDGATECTGWQWFKFDGTTTGCEACDNTPDGMACVCASMMCTSPALGTVVTKVVINK